MYSPNSPTDGRGTEQGYGEVRREENHTWEIHDGIVWIEPKSPQQQDKEREEERERKQRAYHDYQLLQLGDEGGVH